MTGRRLVVALYVLVVVAASVAVVVAVRRRHAARSAVPPGAAIAAAAPAAPAQPGRKIKAHLYYVSMDGLKLTAVDREVAYGDGAAAQAQEIVNAQLAAAAPPLVSAMPPGTALRALYLNDKGEAYVDLSKEVSAMHTGGTLDELLTVYTVVDALTTNLPAITSVQILVDGKEVETLAGHVDLRQPLEEDLSLVEQPAKP